MVGNSNNRVPSIVCGCLYCVIILKEGNEVEQTKIKNELERNQIYGCLISFIRLNNNIYFIFIYIIRHCADSKSSTSTLSIRHKQHTAEW